MEWGMKKPGLILILITAALLAGTILLAPDSTAQGAGGRETIQAELVNAAQTESTTVSVNPVVQIAVGLTGLLFGVLSFLPFLQDEDRWRSAN
jgi:hypothetical protein